MLKYPRSFYSWKEPNNPSAPCCHAGVTRLPPLVEPPRIAVGPPRPPRPPRRLANYYIDLPLDVAAAIAPPPRIALNSKIISATVFFSYSAI